MLIKIHWYCVKSFQSVLDLHKTEKADLISILQRRNVRPGVTCSVSLNIVNSRGLLSITVPYPESGYEFFFILVNVKT